LWEGKFLRAVLIDYPDSCGKIRHWEAVERVCCDGIVAVVPFTDDGMVIVIRQFRPPVGGYVIELPAGLCDPGEKPEDAARRELIEETGYAAGELRFLTEGPISSGLSSERLAVFAATGLSYVGIGKRDETEDIEVIKLPLDSLYSELDTIRMAGNYIDLKVYGFVELARRSLG
jgi:8-oxo-dGTP pyrophosphatase MutT (NUDIX family)